MQLVYACTYTSSRAESTSSAVVVDVQMRTSADDGKGNSGFFIYSDKTVFRMSPRYNKYYRYCEQNVKFRYTLGIA